MNINLDLGPKTQSESDSPYKVTERSMNQKRKLVKPSQLVVPKLSLGEAIHTEPDENGLLTFSVPEYAVNKRIHHLNKFSGKNNTKIVIIEATPKVSENRETLPTLENNTDRLETESARLIAPSTNRTVPRSSHRRQTEVPTPRQRSSNKKNTIIPNWLGWNPFSKDPTRNKIFPTFGTVDDILEKERDKKRIRARRNWAKARYLWRLTKVTGMLSSTLNERDAKISMGRAANEINRQNTLWIQVKQWYINPNSSGYITWQCVFQLLLVYYIIVNPYLLVFRIEETLFEIINYVIDGLYVFDILLHFNVALKNNRTGDLTWNKRIIAMDYLKGTLIPDIIAISPFYLIDKGLYVLKFIRVIRLMVLFRYVNFVCEKVTSVLIKGHKSIKISRFISSFVLLVFFLLIVSHFGACLWIEMGYTDDPNEMTWFIHSHGYQPGLSPRDFIGGPSTIYTESLFQVVSTLTTVAYGSYTGHTIREYLFLMVFMFFGILFFGCLMYGLKATIYSFEEVEKKQKEKMEGIETWLNVIERMVKNLRGVLNHKLMSKVKTILKFKNRDDIPDLFLNNSFYQALPFKEKEQLLKFSFAHLREFFQILFKHLSEPFVNDMLLQGEPKCYLPAETIILKGKYPLGIYLILEGQIFITGSTFEKSFRKLKEGSYFGDFSLMSDHCSLHSYIAKTACRCIFIKKEVFQELEKKYPSDLKKIKSLAYFRSSYFRYAKKQKENMTGEDDIVHYLQKSPVRKRSFISKASGESYRKNSDFEYSNDQITDIDKLKKSSSFAPYKNNDVLSVPTKNINYRPRTLPPMEKKELDALLKTESISRQNESEIETILSEGSVESFGVESEDENDMSENSELNYSDIFPLESFEHMCNVPSGGENLILCLEERIEFYEQKLEKVQRQMRMEVDLYTKMLNRKMKEKFDDDLS